MIRQITQVSACRSTCNEIVCFMYQIITFIVVRAEIKRLAKSNVSSVTRGLPVEYPSYEIMLSDIILTSEDIDR